MIVNDYIVVSVMITDCNNNDANTVSIYVIMFYVITIMMIAI